MNKFIRMSIVSAFLIFSSNGLKAQYVFQSDAHYIPENREILDSLGIETFDSKNLFEMRVWAEPCFSPTDLFRFVLRNDDTWYVEKFDYWINKEGSGLKKEMIELGKDWNVVMDSLIDLGILTLRDWSEVSKDCKGEMQIINGDTAYLNHYILDGISYTVELLTNQNKRKYRYSNPHEYSNFYKNVKELNSIVRILDVIFVKTFPTDLSRK